MKGALKRIQRNWEELARKDPYWAILTSSGKQGNRWDLGEFFRTGEVEIQASLAHLEGVGLAVRRRAALDFGCGAGRLTQAIAGHFEQVYGVDIAPSMIKQARKHNRYGERCRYVLNETDDLRLFPDASFDFIYSYITLQHIEPADAKRYLAEFLRLLTPEGLLVFQLPTRRLRGRFRGVLTKAFPRLAQAYRKLRSGGSEPQMEMHVIDKATVMGFLADRGAPVLDSQETVTHDGWLSVQYVVGAPARPGHVSA